MMISLIDVMSSMNIYENGHTHVSVFFLFSTNYKKGVLTDIERKEN